MGRKRTTNTNLPPMMRARTQKSGKVFYYFESKKRKEIPLGSDYHAAVKKWAELAEEPICTTFPELADMYVATGMTKLKPKTQHEYKLSIKRLKEFFSDPSPAPITDITPEHIYQYGDKHQEHRVQASRDKSTLSAIFTFARKKGYLRGNNPCAGVMFEGGKSQRTVLVDNDIVRLVYAAGDDTLKDAIDLAYLIGQNPQDILALDDFSIKNETELVYERRKVKGRGGAPIRVAITGRLKAVIARCQERKKREKVWTSSLLTNGHGKALTYTMLRNRFDEARDRAAEANPKLAAQIREFQFRDLRSKAGTVKAEEQGLVAAQRFLGHAKATTTDIYIRSRGVKVEPNR